MGYSKRNPVFHSDYMVIRTVDRFLMIVDFIQRRFPGSTPASSSQNTRSITASPAPVPVPPLPAARRKKGKWWNPFSKRTSAQPTDGVRRTNAANGLLSSSLARLKRSTRASSAVSVSSYHTAPGIAGASSAIEISQSNLWGDDEEESCPICADDLYSPHMQAVKLSCQHIFHRDCIQNWLDRDTTCPYW
ncbi:hypothetical protein BJV82DRAFT_607708 [Fennellomyces sp. T-0311]|nr:hypothetical protein BJV82DRAFT_607708 [Fennellomyces sp. T-0311]